MRRVRAPQVPLDFLGEDLQSRLSVAVRDATRYAIVTLTMIS